MQPQPPHIDAASVLTWLAGLLGVSLTQTASTYITLLGAAAIGGAFAVASKPRATPSRPPWLEVLRAAGEILSRVALAMVMSSAVMSMVPGDPRVIMAPVAALLAYKGADLVFGLLWPRVGQRKAHPGDTP